MRSKLFKIVATTTLVLMLLPAVSGAQVQADQSIAIDRAAEDTSALQSTLGDMDFSIAPQTGMARFLRLTPGQSEAVARQIGAQGSGEAQAFAFMQAYGALFGVGDAGAELRLAQVQVDQLGYTHVSYDQVYQGVPVFAGVLRVHLDPAGMITAVNGLFIPDLTVNATPTLSAERAARIAEAAVNGLAGEADASRDADAERAGAIDTALLVFRENLARGIPGANHLAFEVEVTNGRDVREFVYVDAHSGKVVDQITGIFDALYRNVYNQDYSGQPIWEEGDDLPFVSPSLDPEVITDVNNVLNYTEDTYNMVAAASNGGYFSYDGADAPMDLVVDSTLIGCPNAMWNGTFAQFCRQVTGDDTVAHEWGHAYTEYTHNLIYAWQPGALSESYSDIFGEVVDLINGEGLDEPGGLRTDGACSAYTSWPPLLTVTAPESIAGDYAAGPAQFGPPVDGTVSGSLMIVEGDGSTVVTTTLGCDPLVNDLTDMIAFIRRGECTFALKVKNAQDAGAIGAVIANHEDGGDSITTMSGDDPTITIQSLFIGYSDGNAIEAEIPGGVDVEFNLATVGTDPDDSYRWLSGEDDPAFGGAIRDMWTPSCYGDPDNTTSDDYMCGTTDNGGVHYNCGVPNHAFALAVDGGDFNGYSIAGIGLTKAFHIYWRAESVYQTPTTDFADHADALEQSCLDLQGADLPDLVTGETSPDVIDEADCAELAEAILAVEMRTFPDQCGYEPVLAKDPPDACATETEPFFQDGFDTDPGTWTLTNEGVYPEYVERDWMWLDSLPDAAQGGFYAEDSLVVGDCVPHSDDQSGVAYLDSPVMIVPAGGAGDRPVVVFDHYFATEPDYDGGNVWIKVNDGDWQLLAASAFHYNAYNAILETADGGNTNPLAGQGAFAGSDEGVVYGSWGQSQIDLSAYAGTGDEIQLRFALGTDGCNGIDGWYLDQVSAYYCLAPAAVVSFDPSSVVSQQLPDRQATKILTINNLGNADLTWELFDGISRADAGTGSGYYALYNADLEAGAYPADSFELPVETTVTSIFAGGFTDLAPGLSAVSALNWYIYEDVDGRPAGYPSDGGGTETWSYSALPTADGVDITYDNITLDLIAAGEDLVLPAGSYWLSVFVETPSYDYPYWYWWIGEGTTALLSNHDEFFEGYPLGWLVLGTGVEFAIMGEFGDCTLPSYTDWLGVDPTSGEVDDGAPGQPVDITFDSTGLGVGTYGGTLCIETNDPVTSLAQVPVSMEVVEPEIIYLPLVLRN